MSITVEHEGSDLERHGIGDKTIDIIFGGLDVGPIFEYLIRVNVELAMVNEKTFTLY